MDSKERKKLHRWEQKNRWMAHYELKYGVLPLEYGAPPPMVGTTTATTNEAMAPTVLKAKCRFCECFGREAPSADYLATKAVAAAAAAAAGIEFPGSPMASSGEAIDDHGSNVDEQGGGGPLKRRKKRQTLKVFGPNFRTDNLESHLTREHPAKWKEYERLRDAEKKAFFPDGGELASAASAKELLLAQQVAAAANAAAQMNMATRNTMAAAAAAAATTGGNGPSNGMALIQAHAGNAKTLLANGVASPIKHMVSTEIMAMIEQLLASPALRQQHATALQQQQHEPTTTTLSAWQSFVRDDETLADADAAARSGEGTVTGECTMVSTELCTVALKNEPLFLYLVDVWIARPSFETTLAMVHASHQLLPDAAALLSSVTPTDIAGAVHQLVALNLACISQLLSYAWGYSLFLRFVTVHNTGFVDVRVQVAVHDELHDLHVVSLALDADGPGVDALGAALLKALTAVDPRATEKIVGLTIDGDHYHMHKYKDIGLWLKKQAQDATSDAAFYVLYSGVYHVSFIVDELLDHCEADQHFLTSLAELETLCRSNTALRGLLGPEPTRFASARWVAVFNACEWLTVHREIIFQWTSEQDSAVQAKLPPAQWWVTLFVLRDVLKDVYAAFKKCREQSGSLADVQKHLRDLVFQLRLKFNIKPTINSDTTGEVAGVASSATAAALAGDLSAAAASAAAAAGENVTSAAASTSARTTTATTAAEPIASHLDPCEFSYDDFVSFVTPLDLFMYYAFQVKSIDGITDHDRDVLYQRFNLVLLLLVNKVLAVINSSPESPVPTTRTSSVTTTSTSHHDHDHHPHQYAMQIPPSIPYDFITMPNVAAMDVLNQQRFRIRTKWTGKMLAMITDDRNRMMSEFAQPSALYEAVTHGAKLQQSGLFQFREAWKPFAVEYASLASFAAVFGGLLSVTRTTDDELAQYFYGGGRHHPQYAVPTLTLEAQLHAAQFHKLHALRRQGDATIV